MDFLSREEHTADISARIEDVRQEIALAAARSGRPAAAIRLVAVTKTHSPAVVQAALAAGVTEIGENYIQEAEEKFAALGWDAAAPVTRHFIGHLQSNKARKAAALFDLIQTVDSLALARRLDVLAAESGRVLSILLQVNISGETEKSGIFPNQLEGLLPEAANLAHIRVLGLMTIGRFEPDPEAARGEFAALRALRDQLRAVAPPAIGLDELSMGMSHDFPVAIEEGATMVRVGSRLFGPRHAH